MAKKISVKKEQMKLLFTIIFLLIYTISFTQNAWTICNSPNFGNRVDDLFMVNSITGYAVCGDGQIVKTNDGGSNWNNISATSSIYCRSVEFVNEKKGFVGGFYWNGSSTINILRKTLDGGTTWSDLTSLLNPKAQKGICGLAVADSNTIYGCGNWFQDSAYIVKSVDGGNSWDFIDMSAYASSLIDMCFISNDTGFATGRSPIPFQTAVILYTTDGGITWVKNFEDTITNEKCWKIQRLNKKTYFASIEDNSIVNPRILKSTDGGMTWTTYLLSASITNYRTQGIGFIDTLNGWAGGDNSHSYQSNDGGITWQSINICPYMNRLFKVNDSLIFATGTKIWKYSPNITSVKLLEEKTIPYSSIISHPNPVNDNLQIDVSLTKATHTLITLMDSQGKRIEVIDNADKTKGNYQYNLVTKSLQEGNYYIVLRTHEDRQILKVLVIH